MTKSTEMERVMGSGEEGDIPSSRGLRAYWALIFPQTGYKKELSSLEADATPQPFSIFAPIRNPPSRQRETISYSSTYFHIVERDQSLPFACRFEILPLAALVVTR